MQPTTLVWIMFRPQRIASRGIHTVPKLPLNSASGVPGLYSPNGLKVAWADYQQFVLSKLNTAIADTENETRVPFHIMQATKSRPELAHVFNYASQAHNNHLFFANLKSDAQTQNPQPTGSLLKRIEKMYGSLDGLKHAIDASASKVLSSGWVFLVETPRKELKVVSTNAAGSPSTFSRVQHLDLNGAASEDTQRELSELQTAVDSRTTNWNIELLALNLWQHAYVPDFGIDGRQKYIDAWWKALDWTKVDERVFKGRI